MSCRLGRRNDHDELDASALDHPHERSYFAAVVAACAGWPGFMNLTNTRWPMRKGASSAETTTSTTRSSLASFAASDFSLRAPKVAATRMTWPVDILLGSASGTI